MAKILGIDFGTRRLGFAVCDEVDAIALPLGMGNVTGVDEAVSQTRKICAERKIDRIVVGLPVNMDGSLGFAVKGVDEFVSLLRRRVGIPVDTWDERLSTSLVERMLVDSGVSRAKRRQVRDKLAAQVILQGYLDAQATKAGEA